MQCSRATLDAKSRAAPQLGVVGVRDKFVGRAPSVIRQRTARALPNAGSEDDNVGHGVGPGHAPAHSRLLEALSDHRLASGFDDTRTNEVATCPEVFVTYAQFVGLEVLGLLA